MYLQYFNGILCVDGHHLYPQVAAPEMLCCNGTLVFLVSSGLSYHGGFFVVAGVEMLNSRSGKFESQKTFIEILRL